MTLENAALIRLAGMQMAEKLRAGEVTSVAAR